MQNENSLFYGKMSLWPDVKRIRQRYPEDTLEHGQVITKDEISKIIGEDKDSNRFKSVVAKWKKVVQEESNHVLRAEPGVGYVVSTDDEKVNICEKYIKGAKEKFKKAAETRSNVDRKSLSSEAKVQHDKNGMMLGTAKAYLQIRSRKAKFPKMIEEN